MAAKIANSPRGQARPHEDPHAVEALVRKLVQHAAHAAERNITAPRNPADPATDRVLIDCEVDGVRCLLARHEPDTAAHSASLSPREQEVARMIAKGYPNKIIASVLEISVWTVSTHLRRMFAKLGVTSRAALVTNLIRHGKL
jgi:DNA-binding NarL/FixJ family response regulator